MVGNDFPFCKESKLTTYGHFCGFCFNACMKNRIKKVRYREVKKVAPKEVQERIDKAFDILFEKVKMVDNPLIEEEYKDTADEILP